MEVLPPCFLLLPALLISLPLLNFHLQSPLLLQHLLLIVALAAVFPQTLLQLPLLLQHLHSLLLEQLPQLLQN